MVTRFAVSAALYYTDRMDEFFTSMDEMQRRIRSGGIVSWQPEEGYAILLKRPGEAVVELAWADDPMDAVQVYKYFCEIAEAGGTL